MLRYGILVVCLLSCAAAPPAATAALLGSTGASATFGSAVVADALDIDLISAAGSLGDPDNPRLFDDLTVDTFNDLPDQDLFVADASSEPAWDAFVAGLQDGTASLAQRIQHVGGPATSLTFLPDPGLMSGVVIERIEIEFSTLTFNTPGPDPLNNGIWTESDYAYEVRFFGVIPEPASAAVLGVGLLAALRRASSRRC